MAPATGSGNIRVCHLASGDLWAGAEVQVAILLSLLVKQRGIDVQSVVLNNGRLAEELAASGVKVTIIDETKYSSFVIFKRLLEFFKKERIDILHSHRYKENILGGIAAKYRRVPYLVRTVHGLSEPFTGIKSFKMAFNAYLNDVTGRYLTDKFIAVSQDIKDTLCKTYKNSEQVVCIHNAIDLTRVKITDDPITKRQNLNIAQNDRIIGIIGRLSSIKGIEYFLKAAKLILDKRSDITFLVVGDGLLRDSLEQLSKELHIDKFVRFLGYQDHIYDLINIMDVVVLSSLHEGIPTVLLEAAVMGKPVVATNVGGIPEVFGQGAFGILVEPKNPERIAEACLTILNSSIDTDKEKLRRKQSIAHEFSSEVMCQRTLEVYKDLMCRRK